MTSVSGDAEESCLPNLQKYSNLALRHGADGVTAVSRPGSRGGSKPNSRPRASRKRCPTFSKCPWCGHLARCYVHARACASAGTTNVSLQKEKVHYFLDGCHRIAMLGITIAQQQMIRSLCMATSAAARICWRVNPLHSSISVHLVRRSSSRKSSKPTQYRSMNEPSKTLPGFRSSQASISSMMPFITAMSPFTRTGSHRSKSSSIFPRREWPYVDSRSLADS